LGLLFLTDFTPVGEKLNTHLSATSTHITNGVQLSLAGTAGGSAGLNRTCTAGNQLEQVYEGPALHDDAMLLTPQSHVVCDGAASI